MFRLRRSERLTRLIHADISVALTEVNWLLTVGGGPGGGGFSYRAPSSVVVDGMPPVKVRDYVMAARVAALAAMAAILVRGIASRNRAIRGTVTNGRKPS
jgi:hypothetical protein